MFALGLMALVLRVVLLAGEQVERGVLRMLRRMSRMSRMSRMVGMLRMVALWVAPVAAGVAALTSGSAAAQTSGDGDAARGQAIVTSRSAGLCVLCHAVPGVPAPQQGTLAPDLAGAGGRWSAEQLRQRLVAPERFNPATLMPSYRRSDGFVRLAPARRGQPIFDAQQLEDVVAYLATLR